MKKRTSPPQESETAGRNLWTTQELAEFLRVPVGTLYAWRYRGEGPPAYTLGRHLRFDPEEVARWLQTRRGEGSA